MSLPPPDPDPAPRATPTPAGARPARRVTAVGVPAHAGRRLAERADLADPRLLGHVAGDAEDAGSWLALAPFAGVAVPPTGPLGPAPAVLRVVFEVADTLRDLYLQTGSLPGEPVSDVLLGPAGEVRLGTLGELSGAERPPESVQVAVLLGWIARIDPTPAAVRVAAARWVGGRLGALCEGIEALWAAHPDLRGDGAAVAALAERLRDVTWISAPALPATPAPAPSAAPERPRRPVVPPAAPMPPLAGAPPPTSLGPTPVVEHVVAPTPSSGTLLPPRPRTTAPAGPRELGWLALGVALGMAVLGLLTFGAGLAGISVLELTRARPAPAPALVVPSPPRLEPPPPAAPAPPPEPPAAPAAPPAPPEPRAARPAPRSAPAAAPPAPAPPEPPPDPPPEPAPAEAWRPGRGADDLRNPFGP